MIMGNVSVFVMAALIMVSTFGANSGLILWEVDYTLWQKTVCFFKQATELKPSSS
jgi:APA family basic amino acid/polyamine antiporter